MNARRKAAAVVIFAWAIAAAVFLTGCSSFGPLAFSLESDYGKFTYQLPDIPTRTLNDK